MGMTWLFRRRAKAGVGFLREKGECHSYNLGKVSSSLTVMEKVQKPYSAAVVRLDGGGHVPTFFDGTYQRHEKDLAISSEAHPHTNCFSFQNEPTNNHSQ